jgi:hypothetical protein
MNLKLILTAVFFIIFGYFIRVAVENYYKNAVLHGRTTSINIEFIDKSLRVERVSPNYVIKLRENGILISDREFSTDTLVTDPSPLVQIHRKFGGESVFDSIHPDDLRSLYPPKVLILATLTKQTKKKIEGIAVFNSKNKEVVFQVEGDGRYIKACPTKNLSAGIYTVRIYLKDGTKTVPVEWKFEVGTETPEGNWGACY